MRQTIGPAVPLPIERLAIRVLVVADGPISYHPDYGFSLSTALDALTDPYEVEHPKYAHLEFTKAHRFGDSHTTPGYDEFRFTEGSLDGFDEVWLFGADNGPWAAQPTRTGPYLADSELRVIAQFMEAGGGVFATGDHEDLGLGLCGAVPRVRNMRKWWFDRPPNSPLPPGELNAPHVLTLDRNDTVQPQAPGADPNAGQETDAVPQPFTPRWYGGIWRHPHPVLCGPRGVIDVMPDHPHEGDCVEPRDLGAKLDYEGFTFEEYPGGIAPEVIAVGHNVVGRRKGQYVITDPRPFGLLGAYDGHLVETKELPGGVGRVFVDSTWHHWFNLNVDALAAEYGTEWEDILGYYRNLALWLAPRRTRGRIARKAALAWRYTYPLVEEIPKYGVSADPDLLHEWGAAVRDATPGAQALGWLLDIAKPLLPAELLPLVDPWSADPGRAELVAQPAAARVADEVLCGLFGGVVAAVAAEYPDGHRMSEDQLDEHFDAVLADGVRTGLAAAAARLDGYADSVAALAAVTRG